MEAWDTLKESAQRYEKIPRNCRSHQRKKMNGAHENPPIIVCIVEEEIMQVLIGKIAPETVRRKPCSYFGLHNDVLVECWKRMATRKRMKHERPSRH